jgi:hypothetical protein
MSQNNWSFFFMFRRLAGDKDIINQFKPQPKSLLSVIRIPDAKNIVKTIENMILSVSGLT